MLIEVLADPTRAVSLTHAEIVQLLAELSQRIGQYAQQISQCEAARSFLAALLADRIKPQADEILSIDEAAAFLKTSPDWLYRNWKGHGLGFKLGDNQLRFSCKVLEAYIQHETPSARGTSG